MKVFVSYASATRDTIKVLVKDLEDIGHTVWFDQVLSGGQSWWEEILLHIQECDVFIFAMSPQSLESEPCRLEREYAIDLAKRIIPVQISNISVASLPSDIAKLHLVDYARQDKADYKSLQQSFASLGKKEPLPNPLPLPPPVPISPINDLAKRLENPELPASEQRAIWNDLRLLVKQTKMSKSASELIGKLKKYPNLIVSVYLEINELDINREERTDATFKFTPLISQEMRKELKKDIRSTILKMGSDRTSLKVGVAFIQITVDRQSSSIMRSSGFGGLYGQQMIRLIIEDAKKASNEDNILSLLNNWELRKSWKWDSDFTSQKRSRLAGTIADAVIEINEFFGNKISRVDISWE